MGTLIRKVEETLVSIAAEAAKTQGNAPHLPLACLTRDGTALGRKLTDLYDLLKAVEASSKAELLEALCRRSLMGAWARFCNSIASPDVLQALGSKPADNELGHSHVLFRTLCVQLAAFRLPQGLSDEEGRLNLTASWLCCGGWKFTIYSVQYLTAYMRARKASLRNPPLPSELASDSSFLNGHLKCIYNSLYLASRPSTPYAQTILSEEGVIPRLVALVSEAQQASDQMLDWACCSMHLLLCAKYPDPAVGPSLCRLSCQVFAAPSNSLLQALRFWWLQAAQAPAGADRGDAASMAVEIVLPACHDRAFARAWAATIGDELGCMASLARQGCKLPVSQMDIGHACIAILFEMLEIPWACSALQRLWPPHRPRCPEVITMVQNVVISNARAIQDTSVRPPSSALPSLLMLLYKALGAHGEVLQAQTEAEMLDVYHRPTLNVLLRSKAPLLLEAALRTICRWVSQPEWAMTACQAGMLAAVMCALLDCKVGPKGVLSMLATLRKALLVSGSDIQLAGYCMLATKALVRAACKPGTAGQEAARLTGRTHAGRKPSNAIWEPVRAYAAAWVLPTMLGLLDAFLVSNAACQRWLGIIAHLVAALAATGPLDDAIVRHLCTVLVRLEGRAILSQRADLLYRMRAIQLLFNITRDVVNAPAHSASRPNARLEAVVQTGLLALLCTETSRVLADEDIATFFGLLATDVLPAAACLLPVDAQTANNVLALTRPFIGLNLNEAVSSSRFGIVMIAEHEKSKALAAMAELVEALEALCGPWDQTGMAAAAALELARFAALGPGCHNPGCKNMSGATEAELPTRKCSGCMKAHYCSAACQKAAWKVHKRACKAQAA
ncbi:hypothetical protein WJX72_011038 [[Myrmecia] bisecta]|uniref:MYND-type domain-containing protein n=1 Tax=[Myrmecia] bisecta TaxID=41462 RepID=A0AAW1PKZ9_9CHLO